MSILNAWNQNETHRRGISLENLGNNSKRLLVSVTDESSLLFRLNQCHRQLTSVENFSRNRGSHFILNQIDPKSFWDYLITPKRFICLLFESA